MSTDLPVIEEFHDEELSGDNGELYLFQWLSSTNKKLGIVPIGDLKPQQADLEKTFIKIVTAADPYPPPGRAIRNLVGRCLITLYTRCETRTLFDTIQAFLRLVGDFKTNDRDVVKIAAFSCLGDLMGIFGVQVMSLMAEICTITIKTHRSSNSPLLRYHALIALYKSLTTAKRAATDALSKDILKQMKSALTDKAFPVQRAATQVLIAMYSTNDATHLTPSDLDSIITQCVKSLDTTDQATRHAHAQLVGHLLAATQIERAVSVPEQTQKGKKDGTGEAQDDDLSPSAAAAETTKPLLTPSEMFVHLSTHFNKPNVSRKTRIGIFDLYASALTKLGATFVENNFALIVSHLLTDIVSTPRSNSSRYEVLLVRSLVGVLLRDLVGVRMLSEQAQISAIQELANAYLKRWPAMMPGQSAPSPKVLVIVLREVAGLLQQLGNAPPPVQNALQEPLVTLLSHPSHTVRVTASWALRCFCYSTPLRLPKTILTVMDKLQRDLSSIVISSSGPEVSFRALGHAYGLAALVSIIPRRPLYVSYDVSAKVLDLATQLLKRAGEHEVKIGGVEVEVAWTLIAALMALGPNFVRPHLPQLLVLWRNALPKPTSKDSGPGAAAGRSVAEWVFLLHVRESALSAVLCFLKNNTALITLDVARRIASLLSNALSFANNFISLNVEDPADALPIALTPTGQRPLNMRDREALLRRRVHQCFTSLGFGSIPDTTQMVLLQGAVSLFASPEGYAGSSVQAAIASSTGTFGGLWTAADGYAYGVACGEVGDMNISGSGLGGGEGGMGAEGIEGHGTRVDYLNRDTVEVALDALNRKPVIGGCEHDPLSVCQARFSDTDYILSEPPAPSTAVVNSAIELFSHLLPLQDLQSTAKIIAQLLESVRSPKLEKNTGRKAAVFVNATVALLMALRYASLTQLRQARDTFGSSQITSLLSPFLMEGLVDGDLVLRFAASESIGRLASLSGTNYLTSQIKDLVDQVVNNRNPNGRAGCALAFGSIYSHVGGLAAGPLLKTTVNVLMSLINDPHPVVHFWSLNALARVIDAASLAYAPFVSSTLGMLLKVYLTESHEKEGGTLSNANISGDLPAYPIVCQVIDAVITVLGPDIQESARTRALVQGLVNEFSLEDDEGICVEAIKCIQHFLMFAPEYADIPDLVNRFRGHLASSRRPLKLASINALYQLVQKDALSMSKLGGDQLVEDLFGMLDDDSSVEGVRNVISSWLQQTVIYNPSAWIDLCQRIMARTTASQQVADAATRQNLRDDEGESLNVGLSQESKAGERSRQTSRWRTQLFALQCLHEICLIVANSGRKEHLNAIVARTLGIPSAGLLFSRVSDLIKMAFTASTAYVTEIRLAGLVVLRDVIEMFAASPDPAYDDALLLEQHQAPITAALTPAFSSDSTPEILASAIDACAIFVGCGIVKDISRMGRILKLLATALEQSKESGMLSLGEAGELSPNASAMLRIYTLSAWAQLQVSSVQQGYLENVVKPYRATLSSLWIASLRDYASIRIDSEFLHDTSSVVDSSYSSLGKEVLLPYYSKSWAIILQAVATAMQAGDPHILAAMDGKEITETKQDLISTADRKEPTAFFFVIFGLVYEALATSSADSSSTTSSRQSSVVSALQALKCLVRPEYSGSAIMEPTIFDEFIALCYRMGMTESAAIQIHLVEMLSVFAASQTSASTGVDFLSLTSPTAHCLRICAHILKQTTSSTRASATQGQLSDRITLISTCITAFTTIAASISTSQKEDIRGVAILLYTDLLKDESSEIDLVSPTLPALKSLLDLPASHRPEERERCSRLIHALLSACLLNIDSMRGRSGVISTKKIKNNMLAAVLVLTVVPSWVKVGRAVVEHGCYLIAQKLLDVDEASLTAAHCAKTLTLSSTSGSPILRQCARLLVPGLIEFIAKMSPLIHDGTITEPQAAAIGEVWKAFAAVFTSTAEEQRARLLGVFLPTISLLLANTAPSQPIAAATTSQTIAQLLSFATTSPSAFKEAAGKLDAPTRELLELCIRRTVGGGAGGAAHSAVKPQISLRSF
ncbi:clathrin-coated vesicle protein [Pholiota conissans]|uniref:Clathrin-coated vesicle protein n=1 Tax=Pholiota conissans TaxID=109636 RepID=A0A9P5YV04_9AGAR|nr:clathrin-coated vesicle protein [Pholiota conissans]